MFCFLFWTTLQLLKISSISFNNYMVARINNHQPNSYGCVSNLGSSGMPTGDLFPEHTTKQFPDQWMLFITALSAVHSGAPISTRLQTDEWPRLRPAFTALSKLQLSNVEAHCGHRFCWLLDTLIVICLPNMPLLLLIAHDLCWTACSGVWRSRF